MADGATRTWSCGPARNPVTGAMQLLGLLLIVCLVIYFVALLGLLLATVIPWFLKVVGPIAWF